MEILEVTAEIYDEVLGSNYLIFGSAIFNEMNKDKCDVVHYLLFKDNKYRLGIIAGIRNNEFYSPFSAPFGGFAFFSADVRLQVIDEVLDLLKNWATEKMLDSIIITLPPSVYNESFIAKQMNCMFRKGFKIAKIDLNYSFNLADFNENYIQNIWHNARKNLNIAQNSGLSFVKCDTDDEKRLAYEIIYINRETRGFPLRMTWLQIADTTTFIPADFFIVKNNIQLPIASAIIFHINHAVAQVIYWGDLPEFSRLKTMNFLSYKVFEYYKLTDKRTVDIGPSTESSLPNYGLCEFKEGIGCSIQSKYTFIQKLQ